MRKTLFSEKLYLRLSSLSSFSSTLTFIAYMFFLQISFHVFFGRQNSSSSSVSIRFHYSACLAKHSFHLLNLFFFVAYLFFFVITKHVNPVKNLRHIFVIALLSIPFRLLFFPPYYFFLFSFPLYEDRSPLFP